MLSAFVFQDNSILQKGIRAWCFIVSQVFMVNVQLADHDITSLGERFIKIPFFVRIDIWAHVLLFTFHVYKLFIKS